MNKLTLAKGIQDLRASSHDLEDEVHRSRKLGGYHRLSEGHRLENDDLSRGPLRV